ncbi:MAG: multiple sugar transport system permease protein [Caldanaerobacter sp.]|uniref:Carbohydrate ABC transporter membrane protein 1 (CUT1 family) n=2 Tax=Caldanaerobacter subterraneus TaxID=911092 RepID=A0A4R2K5V3_9THEO|nr:sugar ABC transporter permease [Pseudothermotoga lettingae]MBE3578315.1 sugar ABC transporter permease [Caldanaerobacter subterraneus]MDI3501791.1 multiple sugar transport system permease protein [Thermoanaerobacter sp.]MDK2793820.1 multiple sugar transport system permease protein [Caldanaerobacter sp.]KUK20168.1 MAG: Binding-protein-dependent transport systems inner membrane component [Pseudothermotoga lettingae]TCO68633.1 carbohydrate ABC transporter membrane protein 1 (CUT1 family) [Cald
MIVTNRKEKVGYYLFLLPAYLIFAVFIFWPVVHSLYLSFFKYNIVTITSPQFVGLRNYLYLLKDEVFWISCKNTLFFVIGTVPVKMFLGLLAAMLLNRKDLKFKAFYRTCFYIPVVVSMVAISIVWMLLFNPGPNGVVNILLSKFGIQPLGWIADSKLALPTVMLLVIWKDLGYIMVIYLAGLMAIPDEIYEAVALDPVSSWQKFWYITWPLLKPTTIFILITQVIDSFQVFTPIYVMTEGGPGYSSTTIVNYLYDKGFREYEMGIACAVAYLLFVVLLVLTILQNKLSKAEEVSYD